MHYADKGHIIHVALINGNFALLLLELDGRAVDAVADVGGGGEALHKFQIQHQ